MQSFATTIGVVPAASKTRTVGLVSALDLRASISDRVTGDVAGGVQQAWRAARTPNGLSCMRIRVHADQVEFEAWGPGADWSLDTAPALVGLDDDPSTFEAYHDIVAKLKHITRKERPAKCFVGGGAC